MSSDNNGYKTTEQKKKKKTPYLTQPVIYGMHAYRSLEPQVRFRTYFEFKGNGWTMYWQVQPDGRYWGDDGGFGIENDVSDRALVTGFLIWLIWDKLNSWKLKRTEDSMD